MIYTLHKPQYGEPREILANLLLTAAAKQCCTVFVLHMGNRDGAVTEGSVRNPARGGGADVSTSHACVLMLHPPAIYDKKNMMKKIIQKK